MQVPANWLMLKVLKQHGLPSKSLPASKVGRDHSSSAKQLLAVVLDSMLTK